MGTKKIQLNVDENIHMALKTAAILNNTTIKSYVTEIVQEDLRRRKLRMFKEEDGQWIIK